MLLGIAASLVISSNAHAQRNRAAYSPPLGYRSPSVVIGIGYSPRYVYPPYGYGPYPYGRYYDNVQGYQPGYSVPEEPQLATDPLIGQIRVLVPDANAKVWFDGALTQQTGNDRSYHTGTLAPGGSYSYRIRAAWFENGQEVIQEQVVPVNPGRASVVDFTRPVKQ